MCVSYRHVRGPSEAAKHSCDCYYRCNDVLNQHYQLYKSKTFWINTHSQLLSYLELSLFELSPNQNRQDELKPGVVAMLKSSPAKLAEASINILSCKTDNDIALELVNICKHAEVRRAHQAQALVCILLQLKARNPNYTIHCTILYNVL